jgi:eukaryotic-like serine/threonine-protein kinase
MHKQLLYLIAAVCLLVVNCSGPELSGDRHSQIATAYWPIFRGDQQLSGVTDTPLPDDLSLLWSFATEYDIISSPVIGHGNVYIGSTDGKVYCIALLDGAKIWEYNTEDDIEASPLLLDNTIYIGNLSGMFVALDARTGQLKWSYDIQSEIMGSANWVAGTDGEQPSILVGCYDTRMYSFDAGTGELQWTYETDYYINGAPATDGRHVVFGGCDEMLYIVSVADGTQKGAVWAGSYIAGSAALVDGRAYLGHYDSKLVCIDIAEQNIVWEYEDKETRGEYFSSPAIGKDRVIIGSRDYYLHCVERKTGRRIWKFQTRDEIDSSPVIAGDRVVACSTDGRVYILNLADGAEVWSYEVGSAILGSPAVTGGMIVVGAEDGRIYAFGENQ